MDRDRPSLALAGVRRVGLATIPVAFLAIFFVYPFAAIIERGLAQDGGLAAPWSALGEVGTGRLLWFTTWQATASTALTLLCGLPLAWAVGRVAFRGRALVNALVLVPFVLPTVVVATGFVALLPEGVERGVGPILAAHVFFNVAVVVRIVGGYWATLAPTAWEAAAVLGATPRFRLRAVTIPLLTPALAAAAALTFLFCFTSFGVVLILGGPGRATLETEIYNQAARAFDLRTAAALSLVQLVAVGTALALATVLESRASPRRRWAGESAALQPATGRRRAAAATVVALGGASLSAPVAMLVWRSLDTADGLGVGFYRALGRETPALLVEPWRTILNSLAFSSLATVLAVAVGLAAALALAPRRPGAGDWLVVLPLGTSAVMLGFGFLIAFDDPPLDFRRSWWLVPVAQAIVAMPFVVRILLPALRAIDPTLREAAAVLGAAPLRRLVHVDLALAGRAVAGAAGLAFAISLGEFGATIFLARAEQPTLTVAIFRFLGRAGAENQGVAAALATCLAALVATVVLVTDRLGRRRRQML